MNYEELLAAREAGKPQKSPMPIGAYYREQVDGKWRGMVDIRAELNESVQFSEALKAECARNKTLGNSHQLHFEPVMDGHDVKQLQLEPGNYQTFEQLLRDNPAVVAERGFIDNVVTQLADICTFLHKQGIYHVCFSPRTVLARKGDNSVMLLSHGSFYKDLKNQEELYGDDIAFVAPEVLSHGPIDERCDVYSISRFVQAIFDQADIPLAYRQALKKAASESPEDRFWTVADMVKAVDKRRNTLKSVATFAIAVVAALVCIGLYFELFPESQPVEFVKPAPRQSTDDLLDDGFSPEELGVVSGDSVNLNEERASQREYEAKAEEIFRKKYEQEADRILSKIYNKEYMSNSEKKFMTESESTIEELMKKQSELGAETGIDPTRSQVIATEIIERLTDQKKKSLGGTNSRGIQKQR